MSCRDLKTPARIARGDLTIHNFIYRGVDETPGGRDNPCERPETVKEWSGRVDLNHRPPGPEPGATNPINAFSGVAYGTTGVISPLLLVPNLYPELRSEKWVLLERGI